LRNLGETPFHLYPGQAIAQQFFYSVVPVRRPKPLWKREDEVVGHVDNMAKCNIGLVQQQHSKFFLWGADIEFFCCNGGLESPAFERLPFLILLDLFVPFTAIGSPQRLTNSISFIVYTSSPHFDGIYSAALPGCQAIGADERCVLSARIVN
jgi:hypothetical protein